MLPPVIDTHCHLTHPRFTSDLPAVLSRARSSGIARMITIGTGIADAYAAREIARAHPTAVHCSAGLDPFACHEAGDAFDQRFAELDALLASNDFCAVGEIGLEYHHPLGSHEVQIAQLERLLDLAVARDLPVIIHVRDAHPDMLACLRRHPRCRGVIHSFDGNADEARAYLDLGYHLSLNGMVTFKPKDYLRTAAALVPNDRLLVETDSPYLAPVPERGKRCEPALVLHTLRAIAELRGQREEDLAQWTTRTATKLFGLPPIA